ncbi:methylated-DNA--[protein]-cysteine S-methyltransferase [Kitasatospora indigofera]|uniref:methylated-DNA--[protein]-cysteine S-methyltransferase n=1 Tax=Kitasatospora indigofera TaxID=67307 RepID=UPI0036920FC7
MTVHTTIDSPLGTLLLVGEESPTAVGGTALAAACVPGTRRAVTVRPGWRHDPAAFEVIADRFARYFDGGLTRFDLECTVTGTDFQRRIWAALDAIPYGSTTTYGRLAAALGLPNGARAVGAANGANPLMIVRPCHRVIGADGSLTGYAGGTERKRQLLVLEGAAAALAGRPESVASS